MKKSIIKVVFWGLLSIILLAIAIPTITVNINNQYYRIRGIDPQDVNSNYLIKEFKFTPSLELQGGSIGTIDIDMTNVKTEDRASVFATNRNNFLLRLYTFQSFLKRSLRSLNFEVQEAISTDNTSYKLLAKFPEVVDKERLSIFTTSGSISVWVDDSANTDPNATEEELANLPYGQRTMAEIGNENIASVNVITDSSCYFNDETTPRNFCLRMTFKADAQSKFNKAFVETATLKYPAILVVDGAPIAVKSTGQTLNVNSPGLSIDWYPLVDDDYETTAILASVLNEAPLSSNVALGEFNTLEATTGVNTLNYLKIAIFSAFIVVNVLLMVYFKKRGWLAVGLNVLFAIFTVAVMKMFGLVLDYALVVGAVASFLVFLSFVSYMLYQIRTAASGGLTETEIDDLYTHTKKYYTYFTILTCIIALFISYFAPAFLLSMFIGFGFGVIMGYIVLSLPGAHLLKILFLKSLAWKIW